MQVLLRWGIQRGTSVIPKATSPDRIKENVGALSFELNAEQMEKLSVLDYQACAPSPLLNLFLTGMGADGGQGAGSAEVLVPGTVLASQGRLQGQNVQHSDADHVCAGSCRPT